MDPKLWQDAAAFASRQHEGHTRRDGRTPYFSHPSRVALTLVHVFGCADDAAIAAALLHDTIEDTTADYDDIEEHFGVVIADLVAALTKNMLLPQRLREPDYDQRLRDADWRARLIKLADCYDNLCDTAAVVPRKLKSMKDKCRRAIALAEPDAKKHAETARAIKALKARMGDLGA